VDRARFGAKRTLMLFGSQLNVKMRTEKQSSLTKKAGGKVTMQGSNANVSHTLNEDERREFTNHINGVRISFVC
jgi:hypothetical protein